MALFNVSKGLMDAVKGVVGNSIQDYVEEQKKVDRMVAEKVLSPKQKKIAAVAGDPNKIDAEDFAKLRAGKTVKESTTYSIDYEEPTRKHEKALSAAHDHIKAKNYKVYHDSGHPNTPANGTNVTKDPKKADIHYHYAMGDDDHHAFTIVKGGAAHDDKELHKIGKNLLKEGVVKEAAERDTPGQHSCAVHVKHSRLGEGKTLYSQHATPNAEGLIEWYDVMFEHGIEKRVPITELEVLVSEMHMNHKKKKGM